MVFPQQTRSHNFFILGKGNMCIFNFKIFLELGMSAFNDFGTAG